VTGPTVPNWIARGYVYQDYPRMAYRITEWRATPTQAVVHVEGLRHELRFSLDDHRRIGGGASSNMRLLPPDDRRVADAVRLSVSRNAVDDLKAAMGERLDASAMDAEELVLAIGRIQRAATKALADLAGLI
jgi:hypothetical protein